MSTLPPAGFSRAQWHVEAIADTGVSHTTQPRQYVVACAWCDAIFFAPTKPDAMAEFRAHQAAMFDEANHERAERRDTERIRRELLDQLDAGGPEFADAVARNLTMNAAASVLDAIAEAINEETR